MGSAPQANQPIQIQVNQPIVQQTIQQAQLSAVLQALKGTAQSPKNK